MIKFTVEQFDVGSVARFIARKKFCFSVKFSDKDESQIEVWIEAV